MKILIFFMETVFPRQVHGGSTTVLKDVALSLGERGDEVTIICRWRSDNREVFKLHPNVTVMPVLKFKELFPDAYFTPPYNISSAIEQVYSLSIKNDIFINFDSNFIFNDVIKDDTPIINCLHDFVYSGALQGSFLFRRGVIIVHSLFVKEALLATAGRFFPDLSRSVKLIPIAIDANLFSRREPKKIYKYLPRRYFKGPVLLCPHRPEVGKGLYEAVIAIERLKKEYGLKDICLLISIGVDEQISNEVKIFYRELRKLIKRHSLQENVVFHQWIPQELMNEYYSLGDVTLCLGNQVESFGNVPLESVLCGTPAIVAKVGAYRTVLPDWCVAKVDPGDVNGAIKKINALLHCKSNLDKQIRYIKRFFSKDKMIKCYQSVIDARVVNKPLNFVPCRRQDLVSAKFSLAPWCYVSKKGIYNDYLKTYRNGDNFSNFIRKINAPFTLHEAERYKFQFEKIYEELQNGYLVTIKK